VFSGLNSTSPNFTPITAAFNVISVHKAQPPLVFVSNLIVSKKNLSNSFIDVVISPVGTLTIFNNTKLPALDNSLSTYR